MRQGTDIKFASPGQQDSVQFICINQVRGVTLFFSCRRYHQPLFVSHVKVSQGTNRGWERLVEPGPHPCWLGGEAQPASQGMERGQELATLHPRGATKGWDGGGTPLPAPEET